jgi:hypothetical protein
MADPVTALTYKRTAISPTQDQISALHATMLPRQNPVQVTVSGLCPECQDPTSFAIPLIGAGGVAFASSTSQTQGASTTEIETARGNGLPEQDATSLIRELRRVMGAFQHLVRWLEPYVAWWLSAPKLPTQVPEQLTMTCRCGVSHNAPEGQVGCGRSWKVNIGADLHLGRVDESQKPTADDLVFAERVKQQFDESLASIRASAEKWRNGLATLLALITAVSLVKGKDTISGLSPWAQYLVGVLLLLGLIFAAVGAWRAMRASFGNPTLVPLAGTALQFSERSLDAGRQAIIDLALAKWLTVFSLSAVALAVGLTWYLQKPASPVAFLQVVRASDHQPYCGELMKGDSTGLTIRHNTDDVKTYKLEELLSIEVVDHC